MSNMYNIMSSLERIEKSLNVDQPQYRGMGDITDLRGTKDHATESNASAAESGERNERNEPNEPNEQKEIASPSVRWSTRTDCPPVGGHVACTVRLCERHVGHG